jgi:hypothetical protein
MQRTKIMTIKQRRSREKAKRQDTETQAKASKVTRAETLITLMGTETGATAADLAAAVGWQVHSVRGFIAGTLKKRTDLSVTAVRVDGATRCRVAAV